MQTQNRFFDDLARLANGAMSAAAGLRQEVDQLIRQQFERFIADRDLVSREDFEAVRDMATKARAEQEALAVRVAVLESRLAAEQQQAQAPARRKASGATAKASKAD